jgi:NAD(P)-dependent dehydrogenase (short-subunit alcohol dehydrogenase family)
MSGLVASGGIVTRVFVTGSADGIGRQTARMLVDAGHQVVLHARNEDRAKVAAEAVPGAAGTVIGDLGSLAQTRTLPAAATDHGPYDAVVHNAGVALSGPRRVTEDGLEETFQVNVLAPYLLTTLMPLPRRLIYLTSGMASGGTIDLDDLQRERRRWDGTGAYCDSKLCDIALAFAMARRHPEVLSNAVCPGWVRSRMGDRAAPTSLRTGAATQVWLATSDEPGAQITGRYLRHMNLLTPPSQAGDVAVQGALLAACAQLAGVQ